MTPDDHANHALVTDPENWTPRPVQVHGTDFLLEDLSMRRDWTIAERLEQWWRRTARPWLMRWAPIAWLLG